MFRTHIILLISAVVFFLPVAFARVPETHDESFDFVHERGQLFTLPETFQELLELPGHPRRILYDHEITSADRRPLRSRQDRENYERAQAHFCENIDDLEHSTGITDATIVNVSNTPPSNLGTFPQALNACLNRGMTLPNWDHSHELLAYLPCFRPQGSPAGNLPELFRTENSNVDRGFWVHADRTSQGSEYGVQSAPQSGAANSRTWYSGLSTRAKVVCVRYATDSEPARATLINQAYENALSYLMERRARYPRESVSSTVSAAMARLLARSQITNAANDTNLSDGGFYRENLTPGEIEGLRLFLTARLEAFRAQLEANYRADEAYTRHHGEIRPSPGSVDAQYQEIASRFSEFSARWNGSAFGPFDALLYAIFYPGNLLDQASQFGGARRIGSGPVTRTWQPAIARQMMRPGARPLPNRPGAQITLTARGWHHVWNGNIDIRHIRSQGGNVYVLTGGLHSVRAAERLLRARPDLREQVTFTTMRNGVVRATFHRNFFNGDAWQAIQLASRHTPGMPAGSKTLFPRNWPPSKIRAAILEAAQFGEDVPQTGNRIIVRRMVVDGVRIEVIINNDPANTTPQVGEIETAYPTWEQP